MNALRFSGRASVITAFAILASAPASAQSLADRVSSGGDGAIQFSFSARPGVCGNGRNYYSVGPSTHFGSVSVVDGAVREACDPGPVRVVVNRAGSTIVSIESFVGTPAAGTTASQPARDLGRVPARQAAEYLLGLAARLEGRPARDALMPGSIADSADVWQPLLAIARDPARPRELRTSALTWLGRVANELNAAPSGQVGTALVAMASDENVEQSVRNQAMTTLSRLPRGEGVPALIQIVNTSPDLWLGKRAMSTLASSGDPRAREALRAIADRANVSDDIRLTAIRGIGQSYATGQDAAFLRQLYTKYSSLAVRESIIGSVASVGGRENMQFLTNVAGNPTEQVELRRSALRAAGSAEAPIGDLVGLYAKVDRPMKEELINILGRRTEPAAVDKLIAIAKTDEDTALRRRAITQLSRSKDPRVAAALREIIVPE